jgi:hypothetical protein
MKTPAKSLVWVAVAAALLVTPSAFAKKKPFTLGLFAGNYSGSLTLTAPDGSTSTGTAALHITVPRNGRSAVLTFTATTGSGDNTSTYQTDLTLAANKTLTTTDLLVGIAGANNAKPGTGAWSQRKRAILFTATNSDSGIVLTGEGHVRDRKRQRLLTLTLVSNNNGDAYTFTTSFTARLPKKPRK